jgi:predicted DNA-binding protein
MTTKPNISTRVPPEWKVKIERLASEAGKRPSQIVSDAIALYLGENNIESLDSRLSQLEQRVSELQSKLRLLSE